VDKNVDDGMPGHGRFFRNDFLYVFFRSCLVLPVSFVFPNEYSVFHQQQTINGCIVNIHVETVIDGKPENTSESAVSKKNLLA
jgi:hypothetical protein